MKKLLSTLILIFFTASLVGCENMNKQDVGTVSGGVIGGLVGSQFGGGSGQLVAIGAGAIAGALIGGSIGKNMDDTDKMKTSQALDNNNVGQPAYWTNQKTGNEYKVTPVKNVTVKSNKYCREYTTTATIAGKQQQLYGTACRQPDGTWKQVK
jgi:surface antigen